MQMGMYAAASNFYQDAAAAFQIAVNKDTKGDNYGHDIKDFFDDINKNGVTIDGKVYKIKFTAIGADVSDAISVAITNHSQHMSDLITLPICFLLLCIGLKSWRLLLIPLLCIIVAYLITNGILFAVKEKFGKYFGYLR